MTKQSVVLYLTSFSPGAVGSFMGCEQEFGGGTVMITREKSHDFHLKIVMDPFHRIYSFPKGDAPTYYLAKVCQKVHENEKKLDRRLGRVQKSATDGG